PAELPNEMRGFKTQQHRWAKGAIQNCRKLLVPIWRSDAPLRAKLEATVQLTCNFTYLMMATLVLLLVPGPDVSFPGAWLVYSAIFWLTTGAVVLFYSCSTRKLYPKTWAVDLLHLPMALALGAGMCVNNSRGVIEALLGRASDFVRTPKSGDQATKRQRRRPTWSAWIEAALSIYFLASTAHGVANANWFAAPFMLLFTLGFGYVAWPAFRDWIYEKRSQHHSNTDLLSPPASSGKLPG
ncbi:MAG: glycosyl transferase family 2, partial [Verrucomicrobiota bacterium]